jgi:hypothetical protein
MRRILVTVLVLGMSALLAPAALATTQTATGGAVTATFTFHGTFPRFSGLHLTIAQSGTVLYDQPVSASGCGTYCAPGGAGAKAASVHVIDLEHTGQPNVVLDLFTGGAHCCSIEQVFTFDPGTSTYVRAERNFGDPGERTEDLAHDGHFEFVTADDAFAYAFTDFAASGLPVQILTFSGGRFVDATQSYPAIIRTDAARWLRIFRHMARQHYADSVGIIAAWAADEYRLGKVAAANRYLHQQARAGHLRSALGASEPHGQRFVAALLRFLHRHGYGR